MFVCLCASVCGACRFSVAKVAMARLVQHLWTLPCGVAGQPLPGAVLPLDAVAA